MPKTIFDIIRHGEPVGGRTYRGHGIDDPLSERGWNQMAEKIGDYSSWEMIISSPMKRCQEFAEFIAAQNTLPLIVEPDFREVGFGNWEGQSPDQIKQNNLQEYEAFYSDPVNNRPAGAEPLSAFIKRVTGSYDRHLKTYQGRHCLIVAHAGVIRAILMYVLGAPPVSMYQLQIPNAGISRISCDTNRSIVEFVNGDLS